MDVNCRLYTGLRLDYRLKPWAPYTSASRAVSAIAELLVLLSRSLCLSRFYCRYVTVNKIIIKQYEAKDRIITR